MLDTGIGKPASLKNTAKDEESKRVMFRRWDQYSSFICFPIQFVKYRKPWTLPVSTGRVHSL